MKYLYTPEEANILPRKIQSGMLIMLLGVYALGAQLFVGNTLKNAKINAEIENVDDKCEFIKSDIIKPLNFPDENFDIILSSQFLYCLPPQKRSLVLQEINRVLKKDGKIIFFESKSFLGWEINIAKSYFENMGYNIEITETKEFRKTCVLSGKKLI